MPLREQATSRAYYAALHEHGTDEQPYRKCVLCEAHVKHLTDHIIHNELGLTFLHSQLLSY